MVCVYKTITNGWSVYRLGRQSTAPPPPPRLAGCGSFNPVGLGSSLGRQGRIHWASSSICLFTSGFILGQTIPTHHLLGSHRAHGEGVGMQLLVKVKQCHQHHEISSRGLVHTRRIAVSRDLFFSHKCNTCLLSKSPGSAHQPPCPPHQTKLIIISCLTCHRWS